MSDKKYKLDGKKLEFYEGHTEEFTRRQFLYNAGMMTVGATLLGPSMGELFASRAMAQSESRSPAIPFVALECAGGINILGNVVAGRDQSGTQYEYGSTLDNYTTQGFGVELHPSRQGVDKTYGIHFHKTSGILEGMNDVLSGKTVNGVLISDMVDGIFMAYRSTDDSSGNPVNSSIPITKLGVRGGLANLVGTTGSVNGGFSATDPVVFDPKLKPPKVDGFASAKKLVSLGSFPPGPPIVGNINERLRLDRNQNYQGFMQRIANISKLRIDSNSSLPDSLKVKIRKTFDESSEMFATYQGQIMDPSNPSHPEKPILDQVFHSPDLANDRELIGILGYLLFNQAPGQDALPPQERLAFIGSAIIGVLGGDYHDGTALTGLNKDRELGRYIGELILYAALKGKKLVIDLYSDGSAYCDSSGIIDTDPLAKGRIIHRSDSPVQSGSLMLVYNHGHPRPIGKEQSVVVRSNSNGDVLRQIGYYLPMKGGGVDLNFNSVANNINLVWRIKILNYMALVEPSKTPAQIVTAFELRFGVRLPADAASMIRFNYAG